jgi:hypothetical protein
MAAPTKDQMKIIVPTAIVGLLVVGFLGWSAICPCGYTPGAYLFGTTAEEPVSDWGFANEVTLCQLQIRAGIRPHAINLNCMATPSGELYLSCSVCDTKYWAGHAVENGWARLRMHDTVYPVQLTRILESGELDRAWAARVKKLNSLETPGSAPPPPDAPRPDRWWTFRVEWRG